MIPADLAARAEAHGLQRGQRRVKMSERTTFRSVAWWSRAGHTLSLVMRGDDGFWRWAPESWEYGRVVRDAPRYSSEAEALSAALAWLDAGEPEVST